MKPQPKRKPKKPEGEEPKKEKPRKDMPDVVAEELKLMETHPVAEEAELRMEWRLGTLPRTKEFLFFVTRDHPKESERSEFDQAFHVGHCAAGTRLGALIDNARFLLGERISGARELQIFYHFAGVTNCGGAERGINDFEDFIYECIGKTFAPQKRVSMTVVGQVATIEEILKPRIEEFIKSADEDTRSRLLLELSFFEVGRFAEDEDLASLCGRLSRVRDALEVYASFFFESNEEFFRKLHAYVVEQCFKVLAENIKRKCDYLEADFFEEVEGSLASKEISRKIVPCVARILELEGHEFVLLARTRQNFRLLEVLEGDLEEIRRLVGIIRSPRFDSLWDRTLIDASTDEMKTLLETLYENCIESILESGNFEALQAFCLRIDAHRSCLQSILDNLDSSTPNKKTVQNHA